MIEFHRHHILSEMNNKKGDLVMKTDILLATYNSERFLETQLNSLFQQTFQDWHLLIRDGGSTDKTLQLVEKFREKYPDQITLLPSQGRSGFLDNFSNLLEASNADYILFCDHDDFWLPEKVEKTVKKLQEMDQMFSPNALNMVHCDSMLTNGELEMISPSMHQSWHLGSTPEKSGYPVDIPVLGCTMGFNRALRNAALPIPSSAGSHDTWIARIAWYCGHTAFLDEPLMKYRIHGSNASCTSANRYPQVLFRWLGKFAEIKKRAHEHLEVPSKVFYERFADKISPEHGKQLKYFAEWSRTGFLKRCVLLLSGKVKANGLFRTAGLLFL